MLWGIGKNGDRNERKGNCKVVSQESIGTDIYSMVIKTKAAKEARAGQFISCIVTTRQNYFQDQLVYVR